MADEWVDIYTAAAELGVTRQTIHRLLNEHEIPRYRRPGQRRTMIRRSDLERMKEPIPLDAPRRGRPRGKAAAAA